jgi:hypothetical protein
MGKKINKVKYNQKRVVAKKPQFVEISEFIPAKCLEKGENKKNFQYLISLLTDSIKLKYNYLKIRK